MVERALESVLRTRRGRIACLLLISAIAAAGCARQPLAPEAAEVPGFLFGLLHGFVIVFSFVGSLFTDIRIYAFPNAGGWYDFGFLLGAMAFLGGGGASSSARTQP
jgi:hypothetical protein